MKDSIDTSLHADSEISLDTIPLKDYVDLLQKEYEGELRKKGSFEERSGIIITLLGAFVIFFFEKVKIVDLLALMNSPLTFLTFVKVICGWVVNISVAIAIIFVVRTISTRRHSCIEIKNIDEEELGSDRLESLVRIALAYRNIIIQNRHLNERRAKTYRWSLYSVLTAILATALYISIV